MQTINPQEYDGKDSVLTAKDYDMTMATQNACNLSGIVKFHAGVVERIWAEANVRKQGTDWVNQHPINRLMAEQIAHLANAGTTTNTNYSFAYGYCLERSKS